MTLYNRSRLHEDTHQAPAVLPADGAYNDPDWINFRLGSSRVTFKIAYTKAAAASGGSLRCKLIWKFIGSDDEAVQSFVDQVAQTVVEPVTAMRFREAEFDGPVYHDGVRHVTVLTFHVPDGAVAVRLLLAERTTVDSPGTSDVVAYVQYGGMC